MAKTRSFGKVTQEVWDCVREASMNDHGTVYDDTENTATTDTPVGQIVMKFEFDAAKDTLTYTILKKPLLVSENQIWSGVQDSVDGCNK